MKVEMGSELRQSILEEAQSYALTPPGPDEITVRMLVDETDMTEKQAREWITEKVRSGEYYVRKNGLNKEGNSRCHVYGKEE